MSHPSLIIAVVGLASARVSSYVKLEWAVRSNGLAPEVSHAFQPVGSQSSIDQVNESSLKRNVSPPALRTR